MKITRTVPEYVTCLYSRIDEIPIFNILAPHIKIKPDNPTSHNPHTLPAAAEDNTIGAKQKKSNLHSSKMTFMKFHSDEFTHSQAPPEHNSPEEAISLTIVTENIHNWNKANKIGAYYFKFVSGKAQNSHQRILAASTNRSKNATSRRKRHPQRCFDRFIIFYG